MNEFETVQTWLRNSYNIGVSAEWLMACLEWIQQENQGLLPSMNELLSQVYQQWLLSDLTEIGEPVLPQNIVSEDKSELVSNYPLQLLSLVDVGFPLYGQKQKLQGRLNPNEEVSADKPFQPAWEPKPSRMLLLQLTDGHTQVQAMEYKQVKDLHPELPSGLKLLVCGRVLCRRGVIMLTPECVQVLGGEVDALVEQNTPLANLENAMMKNREDEGKHARKEFSGQFISRGADKKLDNSQKPFVKRDDYNKLSSYQQFNSQQVKWETHEPVPTNSGLLNLKQETGQAVLDKAELQHLKQESKQQEDEITYDDCFSDDLDLEEIDALDTTSATDMDVKSHSNSAPDISGSASSVSEPVEIDNARLLRLQNENGINRISDSRFSLFSQPTGMNKVTMTTSHNKHHVVGNFPNMEESDVDFFDDNFEIDNLSDTAIPDDICLNKGHNVLEISSPKKIVRSSSFKIEKSTAFNPSQKSKFLPEQVTNGMNQRTLKMSLSLEQNNSSRNSGKSSPSFPCQLIKPANTNTSIQPKSSVSKSCSVPSRGVQNAPIGKKLFRVKSNPRESVENLGSSGGAQAKKQCKLSDMFRSNFCRSKTKQMSLDDDCAIIDDDSIPHSKQRIFDDDCSIIDDDAVPQSSPLLVQKNDLTKYSPSSSKPVDMPSVSAFIKKERDQEGEDIQNKLPRAVIRPFPVSGDCADQSVTVNSLPFQYLSDLANMHPPASVTVKAYISTLIDKLGINGGAYWSLSCRINDGTACMDVDLADSVLTELIGFSARDSVIMRQKLKTEPQVKDILMEGLTKCQQKLISISCLMEVDAVSLTKKPVVKRLIQLSRQHVCQLMDRVGKQVSASF